MKDGRFYIFSYVTRFSTLDVGNPQSSLENREAGLDYGIINCGWDGEKKNQKWMNSWFRLRCSSIIRTGWIPLRGSGGWVS